MIRTLGTILTAGILLTIPVPSQADMPETDKSTNEACVTVRIWDRTQVDSRTWNRARAVVEGLFKPMGIRFNWLHCPVADDPGSLACSAPTGANDISLRIYRRTKGDFRIKSHSKGGFALLLTPEGGNGIIHLFSDWLIEVSRSQQVPLGLVLGITTAHEIGHLLLPRQPHALAGVMRAELSAKDWRLAAEAGLGFTDGQQRIILMGVQARSSQLLPSLLTTSLGSRIPQHM